MMRSKGECVGIRNETGGGEEVVGVTVVRV